MSSSARGYYQPAPTSIQAGFTSRALTRLGTAFIAAGSRLADQDRSAEVALFKQHIERRTDACAIAHSGVYLLL
ncbi:hypothetical protein MUG94_01200 [Arthrobacter gengyunqii]|uniref:Uncharacterized protein n=1 Tax=Arthrobacter gengyunqii TaxID=2886940 RepID=A0A9X1S811_9MICC|nr:hypothetical protein [Arthrobacter gengyunqii]MCC3267578.1 hypothetical protein [Arthrobacter gengyunqii]MCC3270867.1 hypothetical protein [Arthrobacter gengyunqii]UOY96442.1 hypothetical protein MUG94_01200 [Arthrobacter gengyunqii]